jgi:hypothetical protein
MSKSVFLSSLLGLALIIFAGSNSVHATGCEELLGDNNYRCQAQADWTSSFETCLNFHSTMSIKSSKFDLSVPSLGNLGCSCKAKGSSTAPVWDDSKEWVCTGDAEGGFVFGGSVAGKGKLKKVYAVKNNGNSFVFNCVVDPSCSPSIQNTTGGNLQNPFAMD